MCLQYHEQCALASNTFSTESRSLSILIPSGPNSPFVYAVARLRSTVGAHVAESCGMPVAVTFALYVRYRTLRGHPAGYKRGCTWLTSADLPARQHGMSREPNESCCRLLRPYGNG